MINPTQTTNSDSGTRMTIDDGMFSSSGLLDTVGTARSVEVGEGQYQSLARRARFETAVTDARTFLQRLVDINVPLSQEDMQEAGELIGCLHRHLQPETTGQEVMELHVLIGAFYATMGDNLAAIQCFCKVYALSSKVHDYRNQNEMMKLIAKGYIDMGQYHYISLTMANHLKFPFATRELFELHVAGLASLTSITPDMLWPLLNPAVEWNDEMKTVMIYCMNRVQTTAEKFVHMCMAYIERFEAASNEWYTACETMEYFCQTRTMATQSAYSSSEQSRGI